jgi:membrane protein
MSVVQTSGGKKGLGLILALAIALFGARNAAGSVITALNIAYEEEESRGLIRVNLLALVITAGAVMLAIVAMIAIAAMGHLGKLFPHLPSALLLLGKVGSYALLIAGAAAAAATLYRYGPDRKEAKWIWITPGSVFAAGAWMLLTLGFGFYAANFGSYGKTYGSLATVVVLLTWMYLSAYILMFGGELNSELEHQTACDTTAGPAKPLGARGAWSADHVASSEEPEKPRADSVPQLRIDEPTRSPPPPAEHPYITSRVVARAGRIAGRPKVGMLGSAMATIGLSMLSRRGRAGAGAALLGSAAGLALLRRKDHD